MIVLDYLTDLVSRVGQWSYLVIFLGAILESATFLGVLVPGESLVLVAGFLAARGMLDLDGLMLVVMLGAILGDNIDYELGQRLGRPWLVRHGHRVSISAARLRRAEEFFSRHGGKAVFFGRFSGMLLNALLKLAFHRARPTLVGLDPNLTTYSFPSGHAMAATVFYGFAAALIVGVLKAWQWRVLAVLVAVMLVMLVGFSRVYLGVHYLSDVLAAVAEGVAWLALCLTAVNTMRQRYS